MQNKIFVLILMTLLTSCAAQKSNYIALPDTHTPGNPIKIHYNGSTPPAVVFIKDKIPSPTSITPDYIPYGDSYWWWH